MKKPNAKKLSLTTQTLRPLQTHELAHAVGGSVSVYNPSGGSVYNPSGGSIQLPSGGSVHLPSGGH